MKEEKLRILSLFGVIFVAIIFTVALPATVAGATITVPDDYLTIQLAINAANPTDTVYVRAGTYYENITIGKSLTLQGEDREATIIDGGATGKVVTVTSSHVTISGFTIKNSGSSLVFPQDAGIVLLYVSNNLISDCIITSNGLNGLYSYRSPYNTIQNCDFTYNEIPPVSGGGVRGAIHLRRSSHNTIADNNIYSNTRHGITVRDPSDYTIITGNHVYSNEASGIHLGHTRNCNITNNISHDNKGDGVEFDGGSYNTVRDNMICSNGGGIRTRFYDYRQTFVGNVIRGNGIGILIGSYELSSYGHIFYHNDIISNTVQVSIKVSGSNTWDNGYPDGGNYWSDYTGADLDNDGIGDTPYVINASNRDRYPLMKSYNFIQVFIDIKPGSCPNPLNAKSKGVLPVAILGTEDFDPADIDPTTVLLSREVCGDGVPPIRWSLEDVATPFEGELCDCHDLNGDGYLDMTLKFKTQDLVEILHLDLEEIAGQTIPLILKGNLKEEAGGTLIEGSDCIKVLKTGKKEK